MTVPHRATANPAGLDGIEFVEFVSADPARLHALFTAFGFSRVMRHATRAVDLYRQGDITLLLNREPGSFAARFGAAARPGHLLDGLARERREAGAHRSDSPRRQGSPRG